jgi:ribonucleotide reductase beta subunit family protein with ferritin-like domain
MEFIRIKTFSNSNFIPIENMSNPTPPNKRFLIFPIQNQDIFNLYKKGSKAVWFPEEIDFSNDGKDFERFTPAEQKMLKFIMAFFAAGDSIVNENILTRFMEEVPFAESRMFYPMQAFMETIHSETYALGIQACVRETKEQDELFQALLTMDGIRKKSQWAIDYVESKTKSLQERLIANVITEGVFFQGAFAVIFWFKQKYPDKLKGIVYSNELIAGDEAIHADHGVMVYRKLSNPLNQNEVFAIFESAMEMERQFVHSFMDKNGVLGLNADMLIAFLEHVCDYWLTELGYDKRFKTKNPLPYMDTLSLRPHTNFFERRNREYTNAKAVNSVVSNDSFVSDTLSF